MIYRVAFPHYFQITAVRELGERACRECGISPQCGVAHLSNMCGHWDKLVLLGYEGDDPVAIMAVELPNPFSQDPLIPLVYNEGSMETGNDLFAMARAYIEGAGYSKVAMINRSRAPDEIWERGIEIRLRARPVNRATRLTVEFKNDGTQVPQTRH